MGIKNLHSFLKKVNSNLYTTINLSDLKNKRIAIDTSIFMCKYKSIYGDKWMKGFYQLITCLQSYSIKLFFVFDSKAPVEKLQEQQNRTDMKNKNKERIELINKDWEEYENMNIPFEIDNFKELLDTKFHHLKKFLEKYEYENRDNIIQILYKLENSVINIKQNDFSLLKELLRLYNISIVIAESEAEATCAMMNRKDIVDGVLTEDTDVLAYGALNMYHNLNMKEQTVKVVSFENILTELNVSKEQFLDLCILCGTDYNKNIYKVGPKKAFDLLKKYESIDNFTIDTSILNHIRVRELFCPKYDTFNIISNDDDIMKKDRDLFCFENNL